MYKRFCKDDCAYKRREKLLKEYTKAKTKRERKN